MARRARARQRRMPTSRTCSEVGRSKGRPAAYEQTTRLADGRYRDSLDEVSLAVELQPLVQHHGDRSTGS